MRYAAKLIKKHPFSYEKWYFLTNYICPNGIPNKLTSFFAFNRKKGMCVRLPV